MTIILDMKGFEVNKSYKLIS